MSVFGRDLNSRRNVLDLEFFLEMFRTMNQNHFIKLRPVRLTLAWFTGYGIVFLSHNKSTSVGLLTAETISRWLLG